jgi:hypothetical protein
MTGRPDDRPQWRAVLDPAAPAPASTLAVGGGGGVAWVVASAVASARAGGCANPVALVGRTDTVDAVTGEVVGSFGSDGLPGGRLLVACGDRRAAVCPSCARVYRGDTFQLVRAGLAGGKSVPAGVAGHPAVFATFTPPGFGPVHTRRTDRTGRAVACRPRRTLPVCGHGLPASCPRRHRPDDVLVGQPLCPGCYDYPGAVLWQAHAGRLWARTTSLVRSRLAGLAGVPVRRLPAVARVSFVRVAEFQRRGLVHLHAVIRLDGPDGPGDEPPAWAGVGLLADAVRAAHATAAVTGPYSPAYGELEVRWGRQVDVQPIPADDPSEQDSAQDSAPAGRVVGRRAVAAYLAKYATKSTHDAGVGLALRRLRRVSDLDGAAVTDHARAMAGTCWRLGGLVEYRGLRLREWAHTLGWRGHTTTKSRRYSTTLGALRQARTEHQDAARRAASQDGSRPQGGQSVVERQWRYVGRGGSPAGSDR